LMVLYSQFRHWQCLDDAKMLPLEGKHMRSLHLMGQFVSNVYDKCRFGGGGDK
jgi:hypothetical protein